jgi:uncharacterized membrane protein
MLTLRLFPFLKAVAFKFAYYLLGIFPVLMIFWGKDYGPYSIVSAAFTYIAIIYLRRELIKRQPVNEGNLAGFIAFGLFLVLCIVLVFNKFGMNWLTRIGN